VAVFSSEVDSVPSCIAVSPEGTVRYWDSIAHENIFVEINADLQVNLGQQFFIIK
jgi:nuclear pore complex protein Nup133